MDVGRLAQDAGFRPQYDLARTYDAYLDWIARTPEFFALPPDAPTRAARRPSTA
jgi:hypothetical protein